jgi:serine/threonine protein phosphatase PrpC
LEKGELQSKEEAREIITELEKKDNTKINDADAVFRCFSTSHQKLLSTCSSLERR